MSNFTYKRLNHFEELLKTQSTQANKVPNDIIHKIEKELQSTGKDINDRDNIKNALKNLRLSSYYKHTTTIMNQLNKSTTFEENLYELIACDKDECGICMEEYTSFAKLSCSHMFCEECVNKLINNKSNKLSCPMCRQTKFFGCAPNKLLTEKEMDELKLMFEKVSYAFTTYCAGDRKNFLNYNFVIKKLCEIKGFNVYTPTFSSEAKQAQCEEIWSKLMKHVKF